MYAAGLITGSWLYQNHEFNLLYKRDVLWSVDSGLNLSFLTRLHLCFDVQSSRSAAESEEWYRNCSFGYLYQRKAYDL